MKKLALLRRLLGGIPEGFDVTYGSRHIKVLDSTGKLLMVFSKGAHKIEEHSLRKARRQLAAAAA